MIIYFCFFCNIFLKKRELSIQIKGFFCEFREFEGCIEHFKKIIY